MRKYTYTASLVEETINILKRADQEISGTNSAIINAVNTILNARGADRLAFDFDEILNLTDFARDDIAAVTKEILNKQEEIKYVLDLDANLTGFIGGLFNSEFKVLCKEFVDKEYVNTLFKNQYMAKNGLFNDINLYSKVAYDSTSADMIELGESLINSFGKLGLRPIRGRESIYKQFENLINNADTNAIITSTSMMAEKLKRVFEMDKVEQTTSSSEEIITKKTKELLQCEKELTNVDTQFNPKDDNQEKTIEANDKIGEQVILEPSTTIDKEQIIVDEDDNQIQSVYNSSPAIDNKQTIEVEEVVINQVEKKNQTTNQTQTNYTNNSIAGNINVSTPSDTPKDSIINDITKKTTSSFGDLTDGSVGSPVSSKTLSSKGNNGESKTVSSLASGIIAAGVVGLGTKAYVDKHKANEDDDKIKAEEWNENPESLSIDYESGIKKDEAIEYLSPEDDLLLTE